jgi:hypothetical protein
MMDLQNFERYCFAYGADLSRWPANLIKSGAACLAHNPQAAIILNDVLVLDTLMAKDAALSMSSTSTTSALQARILAKAHNDLHVSPFLSTLTQPYYFGPLLVVTLLLGLILGWQDSNFTPPEVKQGQAWVLAPDHNLDL